MHLGKRWLYTYTAGRGPGSQSTTVFPSINAGQRTQAYMADKTRRFLIAFESAGLQVGTADRETGWDVCIQASSHGPTSTRPAYAQPMGLGHSGSQVAHSQASHYQATGSAGFGRCSECLKELPKPRCEALGFSTAPPLCPSPLGCFSSPEPEDQDVKNANHQPATTGSQAAAARHATM